MAFAIQRSTTALHILQAPHGTGITTRHHRQGEVLVSNGVHTAEFRFDKVTHAPFQESLYAAVGHAALVQRGMTGPAHCSTWVAGNVAVEEVWDVYKVFAANTVKALLAKAPVELPHSSLPREAPVLACSVRCVYPGGCVDVVQGAELAGDGHAGWDRCARASVPDAASFATLLHAALRSLRGAGEHRRRPPLLQICLFVERPPPSATRPSASDSSFLLTLSPPIPDVCRAFAAEADTLQRALLRVRAGRWTDNSLLKFAFPSSVSTLEAFTLVTCVGGGEELVRGPATGPNAAILSACRFGHRDPAAAFLADGDSRLNHTPSAPPEERVGVSVIDADGCSDNEGSSGSRNRRGGGAPVAFPSDLCAPPHQGGPAPAAQPAAAPPSSTSRDAARADFDRFDRFPTFGRTADRFVGRPAPPHTARATPLKKRAQDEAARPSSGRRGDALGAPGRAEGEWGGAAAQAKALRAAEEALRAAEERMAKAQRTSLAARQLTRSSQAEIAAACARYDEELSHRRSQLRELQCRCAEANAALEGMKSQSIELREEALRKAAGAPEAAQDPPRGLPAVEDAKGPSRSVGGALQEQCAPLADAYVTHILRIASSYTAFVGLCQEAFDAAAASVREETLCCLRERCGARSLRGAMGADGATASKGEARRADTSSERRESATQTDADAASSEVDQLAEVQRALEHGVAAILQELDSVAGDVADAETAMLRGSERSLQILQLSEAESASRYAALLDRCTALIEMNGSRRRGSVESSTLSQ